MLNQSLENSFFEEKVNLMIEVSKKNINFTNIEIDDYWNLGSKTEHKMHKIHTYFSYSKSFRICVERKTKCT